MRQLVCGPVSWTDRQPVTSGEGSLTICEQQCGIRTITLNNPKKRLYFSFCWLFETNLGHSYLKICNSLLLNDDFNNVLNII